MSNEYAIINGEFILKEDAKILVSDLSIQRGYGIFDYFRTINNQPVFLEDHLDRFFYSVSQMNMRPDTDRDQIGNLIQQLIKKNNIPDSGIRITLTGGYSEDNYSISKPNLLITQNAFTFNKEMFNKGIRLITYDHQRQLPHIKTIDYLMAILLQPFIKEKDADDVLYYEQTEIRECPRSNFFIVNKNNEVITPSRNILKGITRKKILGLPGISIKESIIKLTDIESAKEAFVTSTTRNVLPVLKIDGKIIGDGKPGPITTDIYQKIFDLKEN